MIMGRREGHDFDRPAKLKPEGSPVRPIGGWPDPVQVQHHAPLGVSQYQPGADDGTEFIAAVTGADIFKAVVENADRGFFTNLPPNAGRLLVEFVTSIHGVGLGTPLIAAAPALLAALLLARKELEDYEQAATGETYNSPQINAAIAMATA